MPSTQHPLQPLPPGFQRTRLALHRVAELIVAPARKPENEIALQAAPDGFGTPPFEWRDEIHKVHVQGTELVHRVGEREQRAELSSLASGAGLVAELLEEPPQDDSPLELDPEAALVLGAWFDLGEQALERLRAEAGPRDKPTPPQLWPEHFDTAIESGSEREGRRANYGFSPGDAEHAEPYLYVGPWRGALEGELWNATAFNGAELDYAELLAADDPLEAASGFCRDRRKALDSMEVSR